MLGGSFMGGRLRGMLMMTDWVVWSVVRRS